MGAVCGLAGGGSGEVSALVVLGSVIWRDNSAGSMWNEDREDRIHFGYAETGIALLRYYPPGKHD